MFDCESYATAALQSDFALPLTLKDMGKSGEADMLETQILHKLHALGESVAQQDLNEGYFDQFVLSFHK